MAYLIPFVSIVLLLQKVSCDGIVQVKLLNYTNTGGLKDTGVCCDPLVFGICESGGGCDPQFYVGIDDVSNPARDNYTAFKYGSVKTGYTPDQANIDYHLLTDLGRGVVNPIIYNFTSSWPGQVMMKVQAWDHEFVIGDAEKIDFMQSALTLSPALAANRNSAPWTTTRIQNRTTMWMDVRVFCGANWYGDQCNVLCLPGGFRYTCGADGSRVCSAGWAGSDCNTYDGAGQVTAANSGQEVSDPVLVTDAGSDQVTDASSDQVTTAADNDCGGGCQNSGLCIGGSCSCRSGYTGNNCETNIDECAGVDCNGGTCIDGINRFTCWCPIGYTGVTCEDAEDGCRNNPCRNGATCEERDHVVYCSCAPGWTGSRCDSDIDECSINICRNSIGCLNTVGAFVCTCQFGWTGPLCDGKINLATSRISKSSIWTFRGKLSDDEILVILNRIITVITEAVSGGSQSTCSVLVYYEVRCFNSESPREAKTILLLRVNRGGEPIPMETLTALANGPFKSVLSSTLLSAEDDNGVNTARDIRLNKFCDKDNDTEYSITWARTVSGKTDFQPCTRTTNGSCSRKCLENNGGTADWAKPNCNGCFDTEFVDLLAKVTNVEKSVLKNETTKIAKQLSSVTNKSEGLTSGNLNASVMLINRLAVLQQNSTLIPNANEIKSIVQATSNVLRENNTKGWKELEVVNNTLASAILFSIDVYGRSLSALNKSSHTREEAENLVLEAWSLPKLDRPANIEFPNRSSWDANSGDGILISMEALEKSISSESGKDLRMWGSYYRTVAEYLPKKKKATSEGVGEISLQSRVISFTVDGLKTDGKLDSPVTITLKHNEEKNISYKRICSFWNFTRSEWDSDGCLLVSTNSTHTVCKCDHLTNFAILMSLNPHHDDTVLSRISVIGLSISVAALILTILVYALTWKHSKSAQATVLLNLCVALTIAYIIFLTGADKIASPENDSPPNSPPTGGCTAVAILLHYFFLAAFFIMLIEGVELLLYIIFVFHVRRTRETIMLIASAWFLPLIIVGVSLGVTKLDGYGHDKACWLSTKKGLIWAFIAPVLTIIVANFVILIIVLRWMTKQKSKLAKNAKKRDDIRATIWNLSVTCPVLGLGWFFGFLSVSFESVVFQYLFVIANSLQGVLIFIFHALFHNKKMNEKISSVYSNYICRCRKADLSISTQSTSSQDQTGKKPPKKSSARKSAKANQGKYDVSQSAGTELTSFNESEAPEPAQTVESTQESQQTVESTDKTTSTPQDEKPNEGTDRKYSLQSTGAETTSFEDSESARLITSPKLQPPSKTGEEPFVPKAVKYYEDIAKKDQPVAAGTTLSAIIDSEALVSTL